MAGLPMLEEGGYGRTERLFLAFADVLGSATAAVLAALTWEVLGNNIRFWHQTQLLSLLCVWTAGLAKSRVSNNLLNGTLVDDLPFITRVVMLWGMAVTLVFTLLGGTPDKVGVTILMVAFGLVTLPLARALAYGVMERITDPSERRAVIVGAGSVGTRLAALLEEDPRSRVRVMGFLDVEPAVHDPDGIGPKLPILGGSRDLQQVILDHRIDDVVIAFSSAPDKTILSLIWECDQLGVRVSMVPRLYEAATVQNVTEVVRGIPLIHADRVRLRGGNVVLKRGFDLFCTLLMLSLLWPVMLLISVAIKLDSRGPVFFRQKRVSVDGGVFTMFKFRSMRTDAEIKRTWTVRNDPRRTRVGRLLRPLNLDELPQLFNVLRGDMSLVGPRPEQPHFVETFEKSIYRYAHRHQVKSGLTGWAQVNGLRGDTSIQERVLYDVHYIENWSFWLDIKIMLLTLSKGGLASHVESASPRAGSMSRSA